MEELTNILLIQRIETIFSPGTDWENSDFQLNIEQVSFQLNENFPEQFTDIKKLHELLIEMRVPHLFNEYNGRTYFMLNAPVV